MIDFSKKLKNKSLSKPTDPIIIYEQQDRQASAGPLRAVQEKILNNWYSDHFEDKDIIIKLHTGEGKTLIGLLALQSRLNSTHEPCMYVCPSIQLATQVSHDAEKFGIKFALDTPGSALPIDFTEGKIILITYIQRLFNGKTRFGLDNSYIKVNSTVLDDSHACIESIRSAYSVNIKKRSEIYNYLITLFESSLRKQGEGSYNDIKNSDTSSIIMQIPYWDWIEKKAEISEFMSNHQDEDGLKFAYPLLKNIWEDCSVFVTSKNIEIVPDYSLIQHFSTFTKAKQRIAMSATTQDDSFFIKGLDFSIDSILKPLTNETSEYSGEKMILFPTLIDNHLHNDVMRKFICTPSTTGTISNVILVPSNYLASEYKKYDAHIAIKENLEQEIQYLQSGNYKDHAVVFVNRYDGIDLADNQCRILLLDSLPIFANLSDRYEQSCREDSELIHVKTAQKIEQGLGRSVRSKKDYSVILIIGDDLVRFIKTSKNQKYFSPQTKRQIKLGEDVTESVKEESSSGHPFKSLLEVIYQCLTRDEGWKQYYQEWMNKLEKPEDSHPLLDQIVLEYNAELAYSVHDYEKAEKFYQELANQNSDRELECGWYLQLVGKCAYHRSKIESDRIQKRAHKLNNYLLKPEGNQYKPIGLINKTSLNMIQNHIRKYECFIDLQLDINSYLSDLNFGSPSKQFEAALQKIGILLGFISERPDQTYKVGPDNLWMSPLNRHFILFECKNEVLSTRLEISKEEVGQMNNHIGWFDQNYQHEANVVYVHVHPCVLLSSQANYNQNVLVMSSKELEALKNNIRNFIKEFSIYDLKTLDEGIIQTALSKHHLTLNDLETRYAVAPKVHNK